MNKEKKWNAAYYTVTAIELNRRQELLKKTKAKVHDLLSDIEEKIHNKEYQHILIRNELDTMLERIMVNVDELQYITDYLYEEFTETCQPLIDRTNPIPVAVRNKSDELLTGAFDENYFEDDYEYEDENIHERVTLTKFEDKLQNVVYGYLSDELKKDDHTSRLDRERDTPEEFSNILNMFPGALSCYPGGIISNYTARLVPFLPVYLGFVMKEDVWKDVPMVKDRNDRNDRCGLIFHGASQRMSFGTNNVLERKPFNHIKTLVETPDTVNDNDLFDEQCTNVLIWLRQNSLFLDTDIQEFNLMNHLLRNTTPALPTGTTGYGAGKRFQFLVNIHSDCLLVTDSEGRIPLYNAAAYTTRCHGNNGLACFSAVFKAGIQHLSHNKGLLMLFQTTNVCRQSPYQCFLNGISKKEERSQRVQAIETVLNDPIASSQHHRSRSSYTTIPVFVEAAASAQITLDGLYFVLRREPDVLQKMLRDNK